MPFPSPDQYVPQYTVLADVIFTSGPRKGELTTIQLTTIYQHQGCADIKQARDHVDFMYGPGAHLSAGNGAYSYRVNHTIIGEILS